MPAPDACFPKVDSLVGRRKEGQYGCGSDLTTQDNLACRHLKLSVKP